MYACIAVLAILASFGDHHGLAPINRSLGSVYKSALWDGYESRPLREAELHSRLDKTDYGLKADITYVDVPLMKTDGCREMGEWPMLLPSSLATTLQISSEVLSGLLAYVAALPSLNLFDVWFPSSVTATHLRCQNILTSPLATTHIPTAHSLQALSSLAPGSGPH